jgi:hypothetical protein
MKGGKNRELGVSRQATSHFHINVAEWIGEADRQTDSIKTLDRNRNAADAIIIITIIFAIKL